MRGFEGLDVLVEIKKLIGHHPPYIAHYEKIKQYLEKFEFEEAEGEIERFREALKTMC